MFAWLMLRSSVLLQGPTRDSNFMVYRGRTFSLHFSVWLIQHDQWNQFWLTFNSSTSVFSSSFLYPLTCGHLRWSQRHPCHHFASPLCAAKYKIALFSSIGYCSQWNYLYTHVCKLWMQTRIYTGLWLHGYAHRKLAAKIQAPFGPLDLPGKHTVLLTYMTTY